MAWKRNGRGCLMFGASHPTVFGDHPSLCAGLWKDILLPSGGFGYQWEWVCLRIPRFGDEKWRCQGFRHLAPCDPAQMSSSSTARREKAAHVLSKARWKVHWTKKMEELQQEGMNFCTKQNIAKHLDLEHLKTFFYSYRLIGCNVLLSEKGA